MRPARRSDRQGAERLVGVAEASRILGVHPSTLRQWTAQGRLRVFVTPGGHRRYAETDLQVFRARTPASGARRALAAVMLTVQPRCGFSQPATHAEYPWLAACDESRRLRPRLLGGALVRLLARYVVADDEEAERYLQQARQHAAEYGALAAELGLSPAAAIEAFTLCRAPIVQAAERWVGEPHASTPAAHASAPETHATLARVSRFFDAALLSMVETLDHPDPAPPLPRTGTSAKPMFAPRSGGGWGLRA
jgi:excisionase family DNA binding protein